MLAPVVAALQAYSKKWHRCQLTHGMCILPQFPGTAVLRCFCNEQVKMLSYGRNMESSA